MKLMCIFSILGGEGVVVSDGMISTLGAEGQLRCFVGSGTLGVTFNSAFCSNDFYLFCVLVEKVIKMSESFFRACN